MSALVDWGCIKKWLKSAGEVSANLDITVVDLPQLRPLAHALTQFLDRRRFGWDNRALIYWLTSARHAAHPPA